MQLLKSSKTIRFAKEVAPAEAAAAPPPERTTMQMNLSRLPSRAGNSSAMGRRSVLRSDTRQRAVALQEPEFFRLVSGMRRPGTTHGTAQLATASTTSESATSHQPRQLSQTRSTNLQKVRYPAPRRVRAGGLLCVGPHIKHPTCRACPSENRPVRVTTHASSMCHCQARQRGACNGALR